MESPIRHLNEKDYNDIIDLWVKCGLKYHSTGRDSFESMSKEFARADTCFFGMFEGDRMIGVVIGTSDGRKGWINRLSIDPEFRRRGLAGRLIKACEDYLHGLGLKVIAALIEDWNIPSLEAFSKAGYEFTDSVLYCSKRTSEDD